ncbi:MAG: DUF177 domain-containing protein [Ignavibacteriales bacterium]|nr:DUF177 domain-containing protein [Ignavibacteriales bacterium]
MKLNISNLPEGVTQHELTGIPSDLGLEEQFFDTVALHVTLEKNIRQLVLSVVIEAKARFRCDRCLEEFETTLRPELRLVYVWNELKTAEFPEEDVHFLKHDDNSIDLSGDAKEYLKLALPLKAVCREECAGLCASCGRNLNAVPSGVCDCGPKESDPRWNKLGDFMETLIKN